MSTKSRPVAGDANASPAGRLMGVAEAATLLNLSTMTVYRRCRDGKWPSGRSGRKILLPARFVRGLLAAIESGRCVDAEEYAETVWPAESQAAGAVA